VRIVAIVAAHLAFRKRHVRAAIELQANIFMALGAGIVDRCLGHQPFHRELRHHVMAVAAGQIVALMNRARPMIARTACVARQTSLRLRFYGGPGILREADDEPLGLRAGGVCGAGTMACLANRNGRVKAIGHVQTQRVQGVGEVFGFELMAGDAGFLADRSCVRRLRIRRNVCIHESRCRPRKTAAIDRTMRRKIRRRK